MIAALIEFIANVVAGWLFGAIPDRQPWRTVVALLYFLAAAAGVGLVIWVLIEAVF